MKVKLITDEWWPFLFRLPDNSVYSGDYEIEADHPLIVEYLRLLEPFEKAHKALLEHLRNENG